MTQTAKTLWRIIENFPDYVSADDATESEEELAQTVLMMMDRFKDDTHAEIERLEKENETLDNARVEAGWRIEQMRNMF